MSDRKAAIARDAIIRAAATALLYLQSLLFLVVIGNRMGLVQYGVWGQVVVTLGLLVPLLSGNLGRACLRFFPSTEDRAELRCGFFSMLLFVFVMAGGTLAGGSFMQTRLSVWLFGTVDYVSYVFPFLVLMSSRTLIFFVRSYFQSRNRIGTYTILEVSLLLAQVALVLGISLSSIDASVGVILVALAAIEGTCLAAMLCVIIRELGWPERVSAVAVGRYLRFSLPLIPNLLLLWIINSSDRYVITHYLGLHDAGVYTAAYQIGRLVNIFIAPISFGFFPVAAAMWDQGDRRAVSRYMGKALQYFATIAVPSVVGLIYIGPRALQVLGGQDFEVDRMVIALLLLGILAYATNQITGYSINLTKRTRAVVPVSVLAAAANLGLNLWLVPRWGILAAAFSTLLAFAGRAVALVFITRHSILPRIDFVVLIKIVVASACMYLALRAIPLDSTPWIAAAIGTGVGVYAVFALILGVIGRGEARLLVSSLRQIRGESFAPKEKP